LKQSPHRVSNPLEAAELISSQFSRIWHVNLPDSSRCEGASDSLGLDSGLVIAIPVPAEAAMNDIDSVIEQATAESQANGVAQSGRDVTPWLLSRVAELTGGRSVTTSACTLHLFSLYDIRSFHRHTEPNTDLALVENNARRAAEIARLLVQKPTGSVGRPRLLEIGRPSLPHVCLALIIRVV
jgi:pseudouridine-5'-phosphate glycosidase